MLLEITLNLLFLNLINYIQHKIERLRQDLYFSVVFTLRYLAALLSSNESLHPYVKLHIYIYIYI